MFLNRKLSVAIFGGAFDPFAKHHKDVIKKILEKKLVDHVVILPVYKSFSGKKLESGYDRIEMCKIATHDMRTDVSVSDFEIENKLADSPIYDVIKKYLDLDINKDKKHYFVLGLDNALNVNKWPHKEKSLNLLPYIVVNRPEQSNSKPIKDSTESYLKSTEGNPHGSTESYLWSTSEWFMKDPHIYLDDLKNSGSSTQARLEYQKNGFSDLLDKNVIEYIKKHNLYKTC
jgi:nicotinate (nicotinamide) nucleotide adenylyltransferase